MAAALLPDGHDYFMDSIVKNNRDLLLYLECCRQAETYISHKFYNVAFDSKFILKEWKCEKIREIPYFINDNKIILNIFSFNTIYRNKLLKKQEYSIDVYCGQIVLMKLYMYVEYVQVDVYQHLRGDALKTAMIYFDNKENVSGMVKIAASEVGRNNQKNVVISSPELLKNYLTVKVNVDRNNKGLFDHYQDHYPAMILMEAGRQLCNFLLKKYGDVDLKNIEFLSLNARFVLYAELYYPLLITTKINKEHTLYCNNEIFLNVEFKQNAKLVSTATYGFFVN